MSGHYQESRLEFERKEPEDSDYPVARGLVVFQYGGTLEECIEKARAEFSLGEEWKVVEYEASND